MYSLTTRKELELMMVPYMLTKDFEKWIFDCYFDLGCYDTQSITEYVEDFAIYAESHEQTGNAFTFMDDENISDEYLRDIISGSFFELMDDVEEVLKYHHLFYIQKDFIYYGIHNMPISKVW